MRSRVLSANLALLFLLAAGVLAWLAWDWSRAPLRVKPQLPGPLADASSAAEGARPGLAAQDTLALDVAAAQGATSSGPTSGRRPALAHAGSLVHGRVLDARDDSPLPDVEVRLDGRGLGRSTTHSAADGSFSLDLDSVDVGAAVYLRVYVPEGWEIDDRRRSLTPEDALAREHVFRLRRRQLATFFGRAVDALSGEPLPFLELQVERSGPLLRADERGEFRSDEPWYLGPIALSGRCDGFPTLPSGSRLSYFVDGREIRQVEQGTPAPGGRSVTGAVVVHTGTLESVPVSLRVGPTFDLDLALPAGLGLGDLQATLARADALGLPDATASSHELAHASFSAVRPGPPPWVRFVAPCAKSMGDPPWRLAVASLDGRWRGEALVQTCSGRAAGRVPVELQLCGALEVALLRPDGSGLHAVEVDLVLPGTPLRRARLVRFGDGRDVASRNLRELRGLQPGSYSVVYDGSDFLPLEVAVSVTPGGRSTVPITLTPRPVAGAVRGRLRSAGGASGFVQQVSLQPLLEGAPRPDPAHVRWSSDERGAFGRFEFAELTPGDYRLELGESGGFAWLPSERLVRPPALDLEFVWQDTAPRVALQMDVLDARTGRNVRGAHIVVRSADDLLIDMRSRSGHHVRLGEAARERALTWSVEARGYESAHGYQDAFAASGRYSGLDLLRARVYLRPTTPDPDE